MTDRLTASTINDEQLDALYARVARAERAARRAEGSENWMAKHLARQDSRVHGLARDRDRWRKRADQVEELLSIAHDTSNKSEAERARAVQRAERAEALLKRYIDLAAVTHKYPIQGGHDSLGENLTCAGCGLAEQATEHLEQHTALQPPAHAHDAGPSIAEAAAHDHRWPLEKEGL
jgi:chromosome segregation ATPase